MNKKIIIIGIILIIVIVIFIIYKLRIIDGSIFLTSNKKFNFTPEDKFTYNFQYAHFHNDQVEEKGEISLSGLLAEFDKFPWIDELNKPEINTSPTISITDRLEKHDLGISIVSFNNEKKYFHLFFVNEKNVIIKENLPEETVKQVIRNFFKRNKNELIAFFK